MLLFPVHLCMYNGVDMVNHINTDLSTW